MAVGCVNRDAPFLLLRECSKLKYLLRCVTCGREFEPEPSLYTCPHCGDRFGTLEVLYDYDRVHFDFLSPHSELGIGQFLPLLPLEGLPKLPFVVGNTPLIKIEKFEKRYGLKAFYLKDDGRNPTASYKDRATYVVIGKAQEWGFKTIFAASTGNAATSLAGLTAAAGLKAVVFVPARIPEGKLAQLLVYGATVLIVDGSYDDAYDLAVEVGFKKGWYCRNTAINPYLLEGKKTGALELALQLNWDVPDVVFVPVGDGTVISGICKGFMELKKIGRIDTIPAVIGVQAEGSDIVKRVFEHYIATGKIVLMDREASTIADSISAGKPRDVVKAVRYVKKTSGTFLSVSDEEIGTALVNLARETGIFVEPAAAAAYAGFLKMAETGDLKNKRVAVFATGNGLKDVKTAQSFVGKPLRVSNDPEEAFHLLDKKIETA